MSNEDNLFFSGSFNFNSMGLMLNIYKLELSELLSSNARIVSLSRSRWETTLATNIFAGLIPIPIAVITARLLLTYKR
ncbi:MAG: hypothetical protein ACXABL_00105 [Candidatus Thorarchaeota archaeon]|jgi:hypothetical protein